MAIAPLPASRQRRLNWRSISLGLIEFCLQRSRRLALTAPDIHLGDPAFDQCYGCLAGGPRCGRLEKCDADFEIKLVWSPRLTQPYLHFWPDLAHVLGATFGGQQPK
jgi:hypothetical protein